MQELQKEQNYPTVVNPQFFLDAIVTTEFPLGVAVADITVTSGFVQHKWPMSRFGYLSRIELPDLTEYWLTQSGIYHATSLVHVLDESANYPNVKNRIMSILEPYLEATEELDFSFPPISSTRGIAKVIHRGTAEPDFYLE